MSAPKPEGVPAPGDPCTLYLIDISSFIFRAFFAIRSLTNRAGEPTNAVYGVATMLARLLEEARPTHALVLYDSKEPSFRKEISADYKANRSAPPPELVPQFGRIETLIAAMAIASVRRSGIEADDLIAHYTRSWLEESPAHRVVIVTGDKDLMALVGERVQVWDTLTQTRYDADRVREKYGVWPRQIRDYLALVGDSSDNIPGVPSIGPKSAVQLLEQFGSLEDVLAAAERGEISGKRGQTLVDNRAAALLSQRLATLRDDVGDEAAQADQALADRLRYRFTYSEALDQFLDAMDFGSLRTRWRQWGALPGATGEVGSDKGESPAPVSQSAPDGGGASALGSAAQVRAPVFATVTTESELEQWIDRVRARGECGFDLETTSLNPRAAQLVGIALAVAEPSASTGAGSADPGVEQVQACYIPVGHTASADTRQLPLTYVLGKLRPLLEDPRIKKVGQNLKYDWSVLAELGIKPEGLGADTMIAAYVLAPEGRHNLETLARQYLGYEVTTFEQVCGKGKEAISFADVPIDQATRYSAEDAWAALTLWRVLKPKLEQEALMEVFASIDLPLLPVLVDMERTGVCIDEAWLEQLRIEFELDAERLVTQVRAFAPTPELGQALNLNSPKQLATLLFEHLGLPPQGRTKTGFSTDASVLEALAPLHAAPRLLLEYREITKLLGTYVEPLPGLRDAKTGRIHASFHQTVAATGRLSSSDPNLQNIPIRSERGLRVRGAFVSSPGAWLVAADYSQIELRLLAHLSQDPELVRAFRSGEDVHRQTAAEIYGVARESVNDEQRAVAKAINFGLMYGKTAFGLAQELGITRKEAASTIARYFERYAGVKAFLDRQIELARERGWTTTAAGRKRRLPDIHAKNPAIRANAERMAMNSPIQGTAADLIKIAMVRLHDALRAERLRAQLIIQVHDELVLDCPEAELEPVERVLRETMEGAMTLSVPLSVNVARGKNWMQL